MPSCGTIPIVASDDHKELLQVGLVIALYLLNSARRARKNVTGASVAYYTVKCLRSGRRSTGYRETDPLHPASQLNGHCRVHSLEEPVFIDRSTDESLTLGEMLPARDDDPATQAGRRLDWDHLIQQLDAITKAILVCLASLPGHHRHRPTPLRAWIVPTRSIWTIDTSPEALWEWLLELRQSHPQLRVALCLEQPAVHLKTFYYLKGSRSAKLLERRLARGAMGRAGQR